jgi:putative effector of murein hydrolase LrgA (UPF0299 family)
MLEMVIADYCTYINVSIQVLMSAVESLICLMPLVLIPASVHMMKRLSYEEWHIAIGP